MASPRILIAMRLSSGVLLAAFLLVAAGAQPASALGPPSAYLVVGGAQQEGTIKDSCWSEAWIVETCVEQDFYVFPRPVLRGGPSTSIVFDKPEPPARVTVRYWTRISRDDVGNAWFDRPRGKSRYVETEVKPIVDTDGVRWAATFDLDQQGIVYLAVKGEWQLDATCPGCRQWATWAFSLKNERATG